MPDTTAPRPDVHKLVLELLDIQSEYTRAQRALEAAKTRRSRVRRRLRGAFPRGEWLEVSGKRIRRRAVRGARSFSLSGFEAAGHEVTPEMEEFISTGRSRDDWDIEDA